MNQKYNDILPLPHPVSETHAPMPLADRAAQFAPFAALVGHDAAIEETARLTDRRIELDEGELAVLDRKWQYLCTHLDEHPLVTVTWFEADKHKDAGAYRTPVGTIDKIVNAKGYICMSSGETIPLCDIVALDSELLRCFISCEDIV